MAIRRREGHWDITARVMGITVVIAIVAVERRAAMREGGVSRYSDSLYGNGRVSGGRGQCIVSRQTMWRGESEGGRVSMVGGQCKEGLIIWESRMEIDNGRRDGNAT